MERKGRPEPELPQRTVNPSERPRKPEAMLGVEKGDLRQALKNLKIVYSWLIMVVRPAWQDYKLFTQSKLGLRGSEPDENKIPQGNALSKQLRKDYEKSRDNFTKVLEKGFALPANNKNRLLQLIIKVEAKDPEDSAAIKNLFYFKNLQPADKGKFIKDFEIVYYMEDLSGVAVTLERRLASMDLAAKLSAKKEAPTGTISRDQQNFDFYEKPIRRKKHGEDIDIFLE